MRPRTTATRVTGALLVALPALLIVGVATFAAPCAVHDDGSVSSCFWAGRAVLGVGVVALAAAVLRTRVDDAKGIEALDAVLGLLGALAALLPGTLIDLCMMATMRCHTVMRPACLVLGLALAAVAVADAACVRARGGEGA